MNIKTVFLTLISIFSLIVIPACQSEEDMMVEYKEDLMREFSTLLKNNTSGITTQFRKATENLHDGWTPTMVVDSVKVTRVDVYTFDGSLDLGANHNNVHKVVYSVCTGWEGMLTERQQTYFSLSISFKKNTREPEQPELKFVCSTMETDQELLEVFCKNFKIGYEIGYLLAPLIFL